MKKSKQLVSDALGLKGLIRWATVSFSVETPSMAFASYVYMYVSRLKMLVKFWESSDTLLYRDEDSAGYFRISKYKKEQIGDFVEVRIKTETTLEEVKEKEAAYHLRLCRIYSSLHYVLHAVLCSSLHFTEIMPETLTFQPKTLYNFHIITSDRLSQAVCGSTLTAFPLF
jgi:hypothetical protein